jgi:dCTP deaminase
VRSSSRGNNDLPERRMGDSYFRTADKEGTYNNKATLKYGESFVIPPGQFGYLLTRDEVIIPANAMAFISMRTAVKFQGLINVSGFHVDPGYHGRLVFAVFNAGALPIHITEGENLFKIWFADLDRESGDDFTFNKPGAVEISNEVIHGMGREILSLQSLSTKLRDFEYSANARLDQQKAILDQMNFIWRALNIAVLIGLFTLMSGVIWNVGEISSTWLWRMGTKFDER